ncbi:energy transducer TonB [Novosphingobium pentaromativorans]|jgi:protein TonB|nr:energy transducer TonB [Novosphingobium pentaromativorans]
MMHQPSHSTDSSTPPSRYAPRRFEPRALLMVILMQGALLAGLTTYRFPMAPPKVQSTLTVHMFELETPPAEPKVERLPKLEQQRSSAKIHTPRPVLELPEPVEVAVGATYEPVPVTVTVPVTAPSPAPFAAPPRPTVVGDLSASMIHAPPPRYPRESRRQREEGAVLLELLLATDGTVQDIRVLRSSGYSRLDSTAIDAVRRWRWSPTRRDGKAMQVRGTVEIPFVLAG